MHRATPANSSFRAYVAGGARATIPGVDDTKLMQESMGNFMSNESRSAIESPQNYGFTSVVMDATKDAEGKVSACAEAFVSFMGGNRSFPVMGNMDDRRYRLQGLEKGDVGMFDHFQHQLHFNKDGIFITGRTDKKLKFQLGDPPQQQSSTTSGPHAQTADASSGGTNGGSGGGHQHGQKKRYDKSGKQFMEMTKDSTNLVHDQAINYKTGQHSFMPPDGASTQAASGPLMSIGGDKLTKGLGYFTKQVSAAAATMSQHLTTKGYVDGLFKQFVPGFKIPAIPKIPPELPIPPFPFPHAMNASEPEEHYSPSELELRLEAMEARLKLIEAKIG